MTSIHIIAAASLALAAATSAVAQTRGRTDRVLRGLARGLRQCPPVHRLRVRGGQRRRRHGRYLRLQRGGAPEDSATVLIGLGWGEAAEAIQERKRARLRIEGGGAPAEFAGVTDDEPESGAMLVRTSDPATAALRGDAQERTRVAVSVEGKDLGAISLSGSLAALC